MGGKRTRWVQDADGARRQQPQASDNHAQLPSAPLPLAPTWAAALHAAAAAIHRQYVVDSAALLRLLRLPRIKHNAVASPHRLLQLQHHPGARDLGGRPGRRNGCGIRRLGGWGPADV